MERAVQLFAVIHLTTAGLSHILAPRAWASFFILLRGKGHAGVLAVGFLSLWFGSIVAAFHPVWSGIPLALTLLGWAQVLKALVYFCFPAWGMRRLAIVSEERARMFVIPGVVLLLLAGLIAYHLTAGTGPVSVAG
jgi:hypothetical protein